MDTIGSKFSLNIVLATLSRDKGNEIQELLLRVLQDTARTVHNTENVEEIPVTCLYAVLGLIGYNVDDRKEFIKKVRTSEKASKKESAEMIAKMRKIKENNSRH